MRPSGIEVNKPLVAFIFLAVTALIWYSISGASITSLWASKVNTGDLAKDTNLAADHTELDKGKDSAKSTELSKGNNSAKNADEVEDTNSAKDKNSVKNTSPATDTDPAMKELPDNAEKDSKLKVTLKTETVTVSTGGKDFKIFTRQGLPEGSSSTQDVLFLHGMKFSSANWAEIGTLNLLPYLGFRAIAVDLPGYGESKEVPEPEDKVDFMKKLMEKLKMNRPVLVSPSMSGEYSIPLLISAADSLGGFVPVAPVRTEAGTKEQYEAVKVPTWIIYGTKDKSGLADAVPISRLKQIPNSKVLPIEDATHPAYLEKPHVFHKYLYNFLLSIRPPKR